jgi:hypothetical protein
MHNPLRRTLACCLLLWTFNFFAQEQPAQPANAAAPLRVIANFPGGSAKVLSTDQANNSLRITPGGDPKRGWPCWWCFRLEGVDTNQPLVLEIVANQSVGQTDTPGQTKRLAPAWSLPAHAAISTDGIAWDHTEPGARQGNHIVYRINTASPTLWLAWGPPFALNLRSNRGQDRG